MKDLKEGLVVHYHKEHGLFHSTFEQEKDLLKLALEFLKMLPLTNVVRKEACTVSGISDLLICYHGRFVAIELKDDIGTPSTLQSKFIADVEDAGGVGAVCRTLADIYGALQLSLN